MATLQDAVIAALESDATLAGLITGGFYDATDFDRDGWTLADVERLPSGRIKPFATLRWGAERPGGGLNTSGRLRVDIYFYADAGQSVIRQAIRRTITLLHLRSFSTTTESVARGQWVPGGTGETVADELGGLPTNSARFDFTYSWRD